MGAPYRFCAAGLGRSGAAGAKRALTPPYALSEAAREELHAVIAANCLEARAIDHVVLLY